MTREFNIYRNGIETKVSVFVDVNHTFDIAKEHNMCISVPFEMAKSFWYMEAIRLNKQSLQLPNLNIHQVAWMKKK